MSDYNIYKVLKEHNLINPEIDGESFSVNDEFEVDILKALGVYSKESRDKWILARFKELKLQGYKIKEVKRKIEEEFHIGAKSIEKIVYR